MVDVPSNRQMSEVLLEFLDGRPNACLFFPLSLYNFLRCPFDERCIAQLALDGFERLLESGNLLFESRSLRFDFNKALERNENLCAVDNRA